jgi:hypothetical protein
VVSQAPQLLQGLQHASSTALWYTQHTLLLRLLLLLATKPAAGGVLPQHHLHHLPWGGGRVAPGGAAGAQA